MNNTEWKTLTADAFPETAEEVYITYVDEDMTVYRSKDAYVIAIDREHMPEKCKNAWKPTVPDYDGKYIIRVFYAEHIVYTDPGTTDPETGVFRCESKGFCSADGMIISIEDENIEYCKYKRLETESLLG